MDPLTGTIAIFAGTFAPVGWLFCNGQELSVSEYQMLYAVIGNTYGGTPNQTFKLPNLQGRVPLHAGTGNGLTPRAFASTGGTEAVTLTPEQIPDHSHGASASTQPGSQSDPTNGIPANTGIFDKEYTNNVGDVTMHSRFIQPQGGGQPHNNIQPSLVLNFIIATEGSYPQRQD